MAQSQMSIDIPAVDYGSGTALSKNTEYTMTGNAVCIGYPLMYSGGSYQFYVNDIKILDILNNIQGYAMRMPVFFTLKVGDKLKITGDGQGLNCWYYPVLGGVTNRSYTYRTFSERRCA